MSEPTPLQTLSILGSEVHAQIARVVLGHPVTAQYQLACIRDLVSEMYALSARLAKQLQNDAAKLTKKDDTNG